ncbi:hypothetical protein IW261DRAFT_344765 [Armillaria novae-zelandiae]|uniref:Uncharacterized protein n=1 Tax=Armillaria novae-zelandiae TaxID=153914 RepID=A0AA39N772_9AGAR|nr:hypothetical protein IW261DRAFT_344765 [Armillaria novae-zelandiae]
MVRRGMDGNRNPGEDQMIPSLADAVQHVVNDLLEAVLLSIFKPAGDSLPQLHLHSEEDSLPIDTYSGSMEIGCERFGGFCDCRIDVELPWRLRPLSRDSRVSSAPMTRFNSECRHDENRTGSRRYTSFGLQVWEDVLVWRKTGGSHRDDCQRSLFSFSRHEILRGTQKIYTAEIRCASDLENRIEVRIRVDPIAQQRRSRLRGMLKRAST